ncbi:uncharacterized protein RCC_10890 [Ramularia collo-cygni]|uniref:Peptidase A1 domain-containing protein n=1 Tax=Ramularia collo-cygni TaxID=112498 RepID=A0A2D3VKQ7_9PEZI|nr:uncharacterized protein RCC_10890 [Ramularia collo-cygni]CZT25161.1 uncharacterized protein RCC_10890 [Ramularia collo-cygni]
MYRTLLPWLILVGHSVSLCTSPPIIVPITSVQLSNGNSRRGIFGTVGTPAQNVSFMVHTYLNDTWIYNATDSFCDSQTVDQCLTYRGGLLDTEKSTSYSHEEDVYAAGGDPSDVAQMPVPHIRYNAWATDTLTMGSASLSTFPIGMPGLDFGGDFDSQANFGLGQNSTLLQRLKDDGRIASRSWSYWWGVENALSRSAMDGHLILGGYDAAKVVGVPFTQPLRNASLACRSGMILPISNLLLNFPNGTSSDLNPSAVLTACLQPDFPSIMTVPAEPYWWRFQDVTGTQFSNKSLGTNWFVPVFPSSNVYAGDLEIQIQGGPAINIPNDVLAVPNEYIDESGVVQHNDSAADVLFSPIDGNNIDDQLIIGKQFFSGAYLTVNLDNQTWSIWPVKATTDTQLTTIGESCDDATNSTTIAQPDDSAESRTGTISNGVIAGIAVGGSCVVIALVILIVFMIRKRKAKRTSATNLAAADFGSRSNDDRVCSDKSQYFAIRHGTVQEMAGSQTVPYELGSEVKPVELGHNGWNGRKSSRHHAVELPATRH